MSEALDEHETNKPTQQLFPGLVPYLVNSTFQNDSWESIRETAVLSLVFRNKKRKGTHAMGQGRIMGAEHEPSIVTYM